MEKKEENRWVEVNTKGPGYPRFCLRTEEKNFLRDLFWSMQMERVWMIDGRMLACRITPMEEFQ